MDPNAARNQVWATLILTFFRYPQAVAMVVLVGLIAPMMISYDLRTKAYLMYFSRPLTPLEYIVGKSAVIWFYLILIVTLPALMLYVCAVFLSPDFSVISQTWDIPLRILAATVVLIVPTTALALCYSAFTSESRYATFTWFATWAMGSVAYRILTFSGQPRQFTRPPRGRRGDWDRQMNSNPEWDQWAAQIDYDKWRLLSPYDTLGKVESWVFGLDATSGSVAPAMILLGVITVGCWWVIRQRIVARLSV
jgi:ABC-2 type transport system permease protein